MKRRNEHNGANEHVFWAGWNGCSSCNVRPSPTAPVAEKWLAGSTAEKLGMTTQLFAITLKSWLWFFCVVSWTSVASARTFYVRASAILSCTLCDEQWFGGQESSTSDFVGRSTVSNLLVSYSAAASCTPVLATAALSGVAAEESCPRPRNVQAADMEEILKESGACGVSPWPSSALG